MPGDKATARPVRLKEPLIVWRSEDSLRVSGEGLSRLKPYAPVCKDSWVWCGHVCKRDTDRHEVKCAVTALELRLLSRRLGAVLPRDSHARGGSYEIRSLWKNVCSLLCPSFN